MRQDTVLEPFQVQLWEQGLLLQDMQNIFLLTSPRRSAYNEDTCSPVHDAIVSDWLRLDHTKQRFDRCRYEDFICCLRNRIKNDSSARVTRARNSLWEERLSQFKLFLFEGDSMRLDSSFYWCEVWDREILGWERLIVKETNSSRKDLYAFYKSRAILYKRLHLSEIKGGAPVEYDFSFSREGPFDTEI